MSQPKLLHPAIDRLPEWAADLGDGYFVGGCVRDWLMGRSLKDIDLVTVADPWQVGKRIADAIGAHLFWLREEQRVARVLLPGRGGVQLDLSPLTGAIEADLLARDFTVNAMASPLADRLRPGAPILDPTGGREDLTRRSLRLVGPETLARDPLRLMRAVRLASQLRFGMTPETEAAVRAAAPALATVSPERVRDELFLILARGHADRVLDRLREFGLLAVTVPETTAVSPADWQTMRARIRTLQRSARDTTLPVNLRRRWREPITEPRSCLAILTSAVLLATARPPGVAISTWVRRNATRLRLGAREAACASAALHQEPVARDLLRRGVARGRDLHHFVRAAGDWATEAILFAASRSEGSEPVTETVRSVLDGVAAEQRALARPLLSGSEVMALLDVPPGPVIGRALDGVAEARSEGIVATADEARQWLLKQTWL